jgi:hypothetical protein
LLLDHFACSDYLACIGDTSMRPEKVLTGIVV